MTVFKAADALITNGHEILLVQQRKPSAHGLWSYPGGRLEAGESSEEAVIREVEEEIGVVLQHHVFLKQYHHDTPHGVIQIDSYTGDFTGQIQLQRDELLAYGWFSLEALETMTDKLRSKLVLEQARDALEAAARA